LKKQPTDFRQSTSYFGDRTLAALTGETKTEAVTNALKHRLEQIKRRGAKRRLADRLDEIAKHCASLPLLDRRSPDELLYDRLSGLSAIR
jgi:antitoxin VapB